MRKLVIHAAAAALLLGGAGAPSAAAPAPEPPRNMTVVLALPKADPCEFAEARPRLPTGAETRTQLYDLLLGQELREAQRAQVLAALKARFPGPASTAFAAMAHARPSDSAKSIRTFEEIVRGLGASYDPAEQVEAARARWMLVGAWKSRHVGAGKEGAFLQVQETYRRSAGGRRWSRLLDEFLRDYRGRGAAFDEFVAAAELEAIYREQGDLTPGEHFADERLLDADVSSVRDTIRARTAAFIARFEASPEERVQRVVLRARDWMAPYELGRAALVPFDRALIARYRGFGDIDVRAEINGAYDRLVMNLGETGQTAARDAAAAEHAAWKAAHYDTGCYRG